MKSEIPYSRKTGKECPTGEQYEGRILEVWQIATSTAASPNILRNNTLRMVPTSTGGASNEKRPAPLGDSCEGMALGSFQHGYHVNNEWEEAVFQPAPLPAITVGHEIRLSDRTL